MDREREREKEKCGDHLKVVSRVVLLTLPPFSFRGLCRHFRVGAIVFSQPQQNHGAAVGQLRCHTYFQRKLSQIAKCTVRVRQNPNGVALGHLSRRQCSDSLRCLAPYCTVGCCCCCCCVCFVPFLAAQNLLAAVAASRKSPYTPAHTGTNTQTHDHTCRAAPANQSDSNQHLPTTATTATVTATRIAFTTASTASTASTATIERTNGRTDC